MPDRVANENVSKGLLKFCVADLAAIVIRYVQYIQGMSIGSYDEYSARKHSLFSQLYS